MNIKNKINLSITAFIILTILIVVFLVYPIFLEIKKGSEDIISQKQKLAEFEAKTKNLEKFKRNFPEIKTNLEKINAIFIDSEVPVDFISFLENISRNCKVQLNISSDLPQKLKGDPWSSLSMQITSAGSFPNFLKFLEKLEQSIYLVEIQNLNITRLSEMELKSKEFEGLILGNVKATFSIKVFTK